MVTYFKRLFTDEGAFVGVFRSVLGALAVAPVEAMPPELRPIVLAAALLMRSNASVK